MKITFVTTSIESDWFIHIDEDCFITDSYPILDKIKYMEEREYDICGPSDGCHEYRSGNHVAFNSFFLIMNKKCIDTWNDWISWNTTFPQFNKDWEMEFPFQKRNKSNYDQPWNVWVPNTEPYYNFFWVLKENEILKSTSKKREKFTLRPFDLNNKHWDKPYSTFGGHIINSYPRYIASQLQENFDIKEFNKECIICID